MRAIGFLWALAGTGFLFAQVKLIDTGKSGDTPQPPVYKLQIRKQPAPTPALRYRLFPETRDLVEGNAAQSYYRAFAPEWQHYSRDKDYATKSEKWLSLPLAEFNEKDLTFPSALAAEIRKASLKTYCDWELTPRFKENGFETLLPDIQGLRELARILAYDCRAQLKKGKLDLALADIRAGLTFGRHIADGPTLIQGLVGVACASIMAPRLEEFMQQPGAPNLYWAFANLPKPFIDFRKPLEGEKIIMDYFLPGFREMLKEKKPQAMSQEQLHACLNRFQRLLENEKDDGLSGLFQKAGLGAVAALNYPAAKKLLTTHGLDPAHLDKIPALQAVFLAELLTYDQLFDDLVKWQYTSVPLLRAKLGEMEKAMKPQLPKMVSPMPLGTLSRMIVPAVHRAMLAPIRLERRLAALQTIEAIRLQADLDKAWPSGPEKITTVPLPIDPETGKPFSFKKEGNKILIPVGPPVGEKPLFHNSYSFELELLDK